MKKEEDNKIFLSCKLPVIRLWFVYNMILEEGCMFLESFICEACPNLLNRTLMLYAYKHTQNLSTMVKGSNG